MLSPIQLAHSASGSRKRERIPLLEGEVMLAHPESTAENRLEQRPFALVLNPGLTADTVQLDGSFLKSTNATTGQTITYLLTPYQDDDGRRVIGHRPNDDGNSVVVRVPVYQE